MRDFLSQSRSGFTLIELLVVVSIIGIVATIGIPVYRKAIQKSRMAEAKLQLGALYKVETTFRDEYDAYANNLASMGFELATQDVTGPFHSGYYSVGFFTGDRCVTPMSIGPDDAATKASLEAKSPQFYTTGYTTLTRSGIGGPATAYCMNGNLDARGTTFLATSNGAIAPGVDNRFATLDETDVWSINEKRELVHVNDGTR